MAKVSDENLDILINGLSDYKKAGVIDPWLLSDGTIIEPLDILKELKELRGNNNPGNSPQPKEQQKYSGESPHRKTVRGEQSESESVAV